MSNDIIATPRDLAGKVAVITGGASGMGKAFAQRFGAAGMKLVLGDIEEPVLAETVTELTALGHEVVAQRTDVSDKASVESLAEFARTSFGEPYLVALNAGVAGGSGRMDELSTKDWEWTLGVNLWGIIHGISAFLPGLKAANEGHVLITASIAGHLCIPSMGPYNVTKHAAVSIAETMSNELREDGVGVGVTCLCPGLVLTGIFQSDRNRPETLTDPGIADEPLSPEDEERRAALFEILLANGKAPEHVAELVHDAVRDNTFWVFTDSDFDDAMADRRNRIHERQMPHSSANLLAIYEDD